MKKGMFWKRVIVVLAVITMVFMNLEDSGMRVSAATTSGEPVFKQTEARNILIGKSYDFDIKNAPSGSTYQWKSSNKAIATVNQKGVVKAKAVGSVTITCKITSGKHSTTLKAKVYVKAPSKKPAKRIKINNKISSMAPEEVYDLNCNYTSAKASDTTNWTSSDTSVAKVDRNGVVTALSKGTVTIKATTLNKSVSDHVTIQVSTTLTVSSQKELNRALKASKATKVIINSKKEMELSIEKGDYSNKKLIVIAPNTTIHNYGVFKEVTIRALKDHSWFEYAIGNMLYVRVSTHIIVDESANCTVRIEHSNSKIDFEIHGITRIDALKACDISVNGDAKTEPVINVGSLGVKIDTKIALTIDASFKASLNLETEAASKSKVTAKDKDAIPKVEGEFKIDVTVDGKVISIGKDGTPDNKTNPEDSKNPSTTHPYNPEIKDDGLDSLGRAVAVYGSPKIDGQIDEIWKNAKTITPKYVQKGVKAQPTFKVMWDDEALYILAEVKDSDLSVASTNAYQQDSMEIFLDENHDATKQYGVDDLHLRVNYKNEKTTDSGDIARLYSSTKEVKGGYVIEARVALNGKSVNDKVLGFDLQINDASGNNRIGTANIFDGTGSAWNDTALLGDLVLTGRPAAPVKVVNPYKLLNAIESAKKLDRTEYVKPEDLDKAIAAAQAVVDKKDVTQQELDDALVALNKTIAALPYTEEAKKVKRFTPVPAEYKLAIKSESKIETLSYTTELAGNGKKHDTKHVNVYLPAGYNQKDTSKKYNVYYLSHGGGENTDTIFKNVPAGQSAELKNILDNMIAKGDIEPMIVVTPSFYASDGSNDITKFDQELVTDIVPLVEGKYNTYTKSTSLADLKASRGHRAFGGFSMGSMTTWNVLVNAMDYFKYFTPFCGGQFAGGDVTPAEAGKKIAQAVRDKGYKPNELYVFACDGSKDITFGGMVPQIEQMKKEKDVFIYNQDKSKGNFYFIVAEGGTHAWGWVNQYVYDVLPDLFDHEAANNGYTPEGRIVANFGTPMIDGTIDDVWKKAIEIKPQIVSNKEVQAKGTFKVLWDDNALYVLAQVKDPNMSVAPSDAYQQDSIEIFMDENNDKTASYGVDDLHFRVNYENTRSVDSGDSNRFYTATKKVDGGYQVEARIEFLNAVKNLDIKGIELQINDAIGNRRVGTINVFDKQGNAWQDTKCFGEVVLSGKEEGAVSGLNPYKLMDLVATAEKMDLTDYKNADVVTKAVQDAKKVLKDKNATQADIDKAYQVLNDAIKSLSVNGLDEQGRMVGKFGSPQIDGKIDTVWDKVPYVAAAASGSGKTDTKAKFKVLWDDRALYVLANVTDKDLDVTSGTVYNRDCVEIFLDEGNNAKENIFDLDDTHYRISCENSHSADRGSLDRLYSEVAKTDSGYVLEARIALQNPTENGKVYGLELQLNDAKNGNRTGTLNVFDKTSSTYASPTRFGKLVIDGKAKGDVTGFDPYDLLNEQQIAKDIQLGRYTEETGKAVTELMNQVDSAIATKDQGKVDDLCKQLDEAIQALQHKNMSEIDEKLSKEKEFRRIPAEYRSAKEYPASEKGTIVREKYSTYLYGNDDSKGDPVNKDLLVYLPAGYDQNDKETRYNVFYLIHGTSENQNTIFGDEGETTELKKVLDKMIANGEMEPCIVVTPTWYELGSVPFHNEIINEILPLIEGKYNTYAESTTPEGLKAARAHRAIGGFSQGSMCIWNIMKRHFDYFKYYVPLSFGSSDMDFPSIVKGYDPRDYYVFAATGSDDIAYSSMKDSIPAMGNLDGLFTYNADLSKGNLYFLCLKDGTHTWQCIDQYLYNIMPDLFFQENAKSTESGLDEKGRVVATYGTPKVDGTIDEIWNKATTIKPQHVGKDVKAQPTFKVLWDDQALYILAQVKDNDQSDKAASAYEQDSMEIFLDENHDATKQYGNDDLHLRVNYKNDKTVDSGDLDRLYTRTTVFNSRYVIEARVELKDLPMNGKVLGFDLQLNDGSGTKRLGTANIFDGENKEWNDTSLFGDLVLTGRPDEVPKLVNPYKLLSAIEKAEKLNKDEYENYEVLLNAINEAKSVVEKENVTQEELDAECVKLAEVIQSLTYTSEAMKVKRFTPLPEQYKVPVTVSGGGIIVTVPYTTEHAGDGTMHDVKHVNVYLPAGYDQNDTSKKYNVYYLSHGGGENTDTIFKNVPEGQSPELKNILDNMIAEGKIQPMIVVTPSFYATSGANDISKFDQELVNDIMPLVESTFNTYARAESIEKAGGSVVSGAAITINKDDMKATRGHRAFGGFSMGGMTTWNIFCNCMDYFKYYTPFCAPCTQDVAKAVRDSEYTAKDFYVFAADGTKDPTYQGMGPQMEKLKEQTDLFIYNKDITIGNFYFIVAEGGTHAWGWVDQYIYDILPDLFDKD